MPSFEIPDSPAQLELRNQAVNGKPYRVATTTFTVTNKTAQAISGRFKIAPQGDAKAEWLQLEGEKERPFGPSETQKINVNVSLPGDVPAGEYKFRLVVMNVNDPGNDFTESAVVTFSPPKIVPNGGQRKIWPYIVAAVVLLLLVGGVVVYLVWPRPGPAVVASGIDIPNVVTTPAMTFEAARQELIDAHFTNVAAAPENGPQATGAQPGRVIDVNPKLPARVPANRAIKLIVDPGVAIPTGLIGTSIADVGNQLAPFTITVHQLGDNGTANIIASFWPSTGPLALHAPLTVNVHSPGCVQHAPYYFCLEKNLPLQDFQMKVLRRQ